MEEVDQVCRRRVFTPIVTFWGFLGQVLVPGSSCRKAVSSTSAWQGLGNPGLPTLYTPASHASGSSATHWDSNDANVPADAVMLLEAATQRGLATLDSARVFAAPDGAGARLLAANRDRVQQLGDSLRTGHMQSRQKPLTVG